jgi:hypothetical protein
LLLSDELHYVHANGMAEAKREFLPPLLGIPRDQEDRAPHGDFTFVFGEAEVEVDRPAGRLNNRLTYTAIYCHRPEIRLVAWHAVKPWSQ